MSYQNSAPNVAARCPNCERAHYDENYFKCVECGAPLDTKANPDTVRY